LRNIELNNSEEKYQQHIISVLIESLNSLGKSEMEFVIGNEIAKLKLVHNPL